MGVVGVTSGEEEQVGGRVASADVSEADDDAGQGEEDLQDAKDDEGQVDEHGVLSGGGLDLAGGDDVAVGAADEAAGVAGVLGEAGRGVDDDEHVGHDRAHAGGEEGQDVGAGGVAADGEGAEDGGDGGDEAAPDAGGVGGVGGRW